MFTIGYMYIPPVTSFKVNSAISRDLNMTIIAPEVCVIDFGDGVKQELSELNVRASISHTYSENNEYIVRIVGNHSNLEMPDNSNIIEALELSNSIIDCYKMFYNNQNMTKIAETFYIPDGCKSCSEMFEATPITSIPDSFTISNTVDNLNSMFAYCDRLIDISSNFVLPDSASNYSNMFARDYELSCDISNMFPDFKYNGTIYIKGLFDYCSKITGTAPADKLWNSGKTFASSTCFQNCTSLSNFSEIPDNWKYNV